MFLRHLGIAMLSLGFLLAGTAQADRQFSLKSDSGAQFHIGNGLALPVQAAIPPAPTLAAGDFPPLLVKPVAGKIINGTTAAGVMGPKRRITVPAGALTKTASQKTVGVFFSNTSLFAVATSLSFSWPKTAAVFSVSAGARGTGVGVTATTLSGAAAGNTIRYSERVVGKRFGGAARFVLSAGAGGGGILAGPVTLYALSPFGPVPPACGPGCPAWILAAYPTQTDAVIGGTKSTTVNTNASPQPALNGGTGTFGTIGTVTGFAFTGAIGLPGPAAASTGYPWTTGKVTIRAANANPMETFLLSGSDSRTAGGAGAIQMVSGSLSNRVVVNQNANRGWLRLNLRDVKLTPALSPLMRGATVLLMMAVPPVAYAIRSRRRRSASA